MSTTRSQPNRRALHARARRGVTFLEALLASVLLAMVASTLAGGVAFMTNSQRRMDQKLGAAELANRLILQYIDDRESLPDRSLPIEYDIDLYRWTLEEAPVEFVFDNIQADDAAGVGGGASLSRIKLITVRVWLSADSGGALAYTSEVPSCTITRLIDPLAFNNPDSLKTLLEQPGGLERLFNSMMEDLGG
jgi:type II secretory pathway pseudopilin PulG